MIGPSSSHTAGACKLGKVAYKLAKGDIKKVVFMLHGSFAKTYRGHGTDKALLGGILGFDADDERIKYSFELAKKEELLFQFEEADLGDVHPNTVKILIEKNDGVKMAIIGSSIGGGNIKIIEIDGVELEFTGEYPTLIVPHRDMPGVIAKTTAILSQYEINIAFMRVYRYNKGNNAFMIIETDSPICTDVIGHIKSVDNVINAYLVTIN
ncbi:L-serine ammonia-lyase [Alkaliphilus peptidifermentans DSM 18978]|uniref:L-serine deaminase n=2 Tax=Alkaliphilus TaxID=114627 RepID=A0A1G5J889_9FIRM|nr:L-serine ammonia-lyase [Alkaliphilus peptidifermentans DSM 18978]